jgi:hypothetical protein
VEKEYHFLLPNNFRFFSSFDSVRFLNNSNTYNINELHIKLDIISSMVFNTGVLLSENQLFDSLGAVKTLNEIISYAEKYNIFFPIQVGIRQLDDSLFPTVARLFAQINEHDTKDRYRLTAYPALDEDYNRRVVWAEYIQRELPIPEKSDDGLTLIQNDEENTLVNCLYTILKYANKTAPLYGGYKANNLIQVFSQNVAQLLSLGQPEKAGDFEKLFTTTTDPFMRNIKSKWINPDRYEQSLEIIQTLNNFQYEIKDSLGIINKRSVIYNNLNLLGGNDALVNGILEAIDSIYNFNLAVALNADSFSDSVKNSFENPYVEAGYFLAAWANYTNKSDHGYYIQSPNGWLINNRLEWESFIENEDIKIAISSLPLEACFSMVTNDKWKEAWANYAYALDRLESLEILNNSLSYLPKTLRDKQASTRSEYNQAYNSLLDIASEVLATTWCKIDVDGDFAEILIKIGGEKTGIIRKTLNAPTFETNTK